MSSIVNRISTGAIALASLVASAVDYNWTPAGNGNWTDVAHWRVGGAATAVYPGQNTPQDTVKDRVVADGGTMLIMR